VVLPNLIIPPNFLSHLHCFIFPINDELSGTTSLVLF
jgi:hypothetical protein